MYTVALRHFNEKKKKARKKERKRMNASVRSKYLEELQKEH